MRPAHKLLKRLLRSRVWEIDWRQTATGKLRADVLLVRPSPGVHVEPPTTAYASPLTWLAWREGRLDAREVTPYMDAELCVVMDLPPDERRYFMRHCRDAMARLCGLRTADKALLTALGAMPHEERLSPQRVVRKPQEARCWEVVVVWSHRPDLQPARYKRFQHAVKQTQMSMRLLDFQPEMQSAKAQAFLKYDQQWQWYCDGPEPEMQDVYASLEPPKRFTSLRPRGCLLN